MPENPKKINDIDDEEIKPQHTIRFNEYQREKLKIVKDYCKKRYKNGKVAFAVHEAIEQYADFLEGKSPMTR